MVLIPVTILGGLPVVAEVWFSGPDYYGEYDSGVDCLYWQKRDGMPGKELPGRVMNRLEKYDSWWEASVTEQANEWLGCNCPTRYSDGTIEGSYSEEYRKLNPARAASGIVAPTGGETRQGLDERSEQSPVGEAETPNPPPPKTSTQGGISHDR